MYVEKCDLLAAALNALQQALLQGVVGVDAHDVAGTAHGGAVKADHRQAAVQYVLDAFVLFHRAGQQDAVHRAAGQIVQAGFFALGVFVGVHDEQAEVLLTEHLLALLDDGGEKFIADVGHHEADEHLFAGFQHAGGDIGVIIQLLNALQDALAGVRLHEAGAVQHMADSGCGDPGVQGYIADGGFDGHSVTLFNSQSKFQTLPV